MSADRVALPLFRYHPDPLATGSVVAAEVVCVCCGRQRPFTYVGPVYAEVDLGRRLCPWCIADGRAAALFGAQFTDVGWRVPEEVAAEATEEVLQRTPGFAGWQQEQWLHHCGDAAEFHGPVGAAELAAFPDALESVRVGIRGDSGGWSAEQTEEYVRSLSGDGPPTAYLFRCRRCGTHLAYSDFG